ncbi:substrate-binding domain-containing protein [Sphaerisporangium sp. NPDC051011]|uniref:substrate-binding domain-containing protein n=1 Tax=Sphaerisporangium sp. NPDC051011 TaxID=3155792 RepID=UPI00340F1A92
MTIRRRAARLALLPLVALLIQVITVPAWAASPVNGSGSSFAFVAIQQWMSDVARLQGLSVNFQSKGSTQGRRDFAGRLVDFASSDVSYQFPNGLGPNDTPPSFPFTYMPLVAGGTAIMVNIKDNAGRPIKNLQLSGPLLVKLFTQNMFSCVDPANNPEMYWDDPAVKADNPTIANSLPHIRVRPVVRAGGSGTTAVFTDYLYQIDPGRVGAYMKGDNRNPLCIQNPSTKCVDKICGPTDEWPDRPDTDKADGSDTLAIKIQQGMGNWGLIGYAEYAYALQLGVPVATIKNVAGSYTLPTACNQAIALTGANRNPDGTYNLDNVHTHPSPSAYPISSYNYVIVPTEGLDPGKGETLAKFVLYSITDGQKNVDQIGYSQLPANLIKQGFAVLGQVPGHPAIPSDSLADTKWGVYYKSLKLPDGTSCEQEGQETKNDPPPQQNNNNQNNNNQNNQNNNQNKNDNNNQNKNDNNKQNNEQNKNQNNQNKDQKNKNDNKQNNEQNKNQNNQNGAKSPNGTPTGNGTGGKTPTPGASTGAPQPGQNTPGPTAPGTNGPTEPGANGTTATGDPNAPATNGLPQSTDPNAPQVPGTPGATGNGMIDPALAANAAREVNTVASSAGAPWGLFGLALLLIAIVFAPGIVGGVRRLVRLSRPGGE